MTTLTWSGCRNVRDLGGLPTRDGAAVRPGRLVRSDNLAGLDDTGRRALLDYGVSRVVDLRGGLPGEQVPQGSPAYADPPPWCGPSSTPLPARWFSIAPPARTAPAWRSPCCSRPRACDGKTSWPTRARLTLSSDSPS